jgi:hypothetical protein
VRQIGVPNFDYGHTKKKRIKKEPAYVRKMERRSHAKIEADMDEYFRKLKINRGHTA